MDFGTKLVNNRRAAGALGHLELKLALAATFCVLLALAAAKLTWKVPKPLLGVLGGSFAGWSAVFWGLNRGTQRPASRLIARLLLPWVCTVPLLLGAVYYFDRGGWVWFKVTGYDVAPVEDLPILSVADFLDRHRIFALASGDPPRLVLQSGEYDVKETIIVPPGATLMLEPGAVLRFGAGRSLISYSPIMALGTESEPIVFTAQNKWLKWGVVGVVDADTSVFAHVNFEHGRYASVNGVEFYGGLSLIETDVEITHSRFRHMFGKDAVYVRRGRVLIRDNTFRDTYKDGLDLDGGAGEISHNRFINCGDEGIDLSETGAVQVFANIILDSGGGRIDADNNLEELKSLNTFGYPEDE